MTPGYLSDAAIAVVEALAARPCGPGRLAETSTRWRQALGVLMARGLVKHAARGWALTSDGRALASFLSEQGA